MNNISEIEQAAQTLCTSCGLCCDGTLFRRANLKPEDTVENLQVAGIPAVDESEKRYFRLPCHHLENKCCKIYHLWRPRICGRFRCKILRRLFKGELSFEQGLEIINTTEKHLEEINELLIESGCSMTQNLHDRYEARQSRGKIADMAITLKYVAFRLRLERDFINIKKDSINQSDQ